MSLLLTKDIGKTEGLTFQQFPNIYRWLNQKRTKASLYGWIGHRPFPFLRFGFSFLGLLFLQSTACGLCNLAYEEVGSALYTCYIQPWAWSNQLYLDLEPIESYPPIHSILIITTKQERLIPISARLTICNDEVARSCYLLVPLVLGLIYYFGRFLWHIIKNMWGLFLML